VEIINKEFLKKNKSIYVAIGTVLVSVFLQLFFIRYVSYNVDKEVYGNYILLQTLIVAMSYVFLQVPSVSYSRYFNESKDKVHFVNEFRSLLIYVNILSLFVILIYGSIFTRFSTEVLFFLFFYFILLNNYSFNKGVFLLNLERKKYFQMHSLEASAKYVFPLIFYYWQESVESLIFGLLIGYSISFFIMIFSLKSYPFAYVINVSNLAKYFKFAYPIIFTAIFSWGIVFSDRYFIDYFMKTEDVAIYSILTQVAGLGAVIGQIYTMYVNPILFKHHSKDRSGTYVLFKNYIKVLVYFFIFVLCIVPMLPLNFFTIIIEKSVIYNPIYYYTFILLVFSVCLSVLQNALSFYFTLEKKLIFTTYAYAIAFVINIFGNFYIVEYGIIAAAISTLTAYIAMNFSLIYFMRRVVRHAS
jgi:O-antigen/teichoic acid export membrane protein